MIDSIKHKGLRTRLVEVVRSKGVSNTKVLEILRKVPRHLFVDGAPDSHIYSDKAYPIAAGQTISQPYTVAFQTQLLDVQKGEKILEIGTGCGYQTSFLLELGAEVYSIERQKELYELTKVKLPQLNYFEARLFYGDGFLGKPTYAPFDKIIITAGAKEVPKELLKQLKIGGFMIAPIGGSSGQRMLKITREAENEFITEDHGSFAFVPMLGGIV